MHISTVIVVHNSVEDLPALFESLPPTVGEHTISVVVVDSGSTDGSLDVARELRPDATLVDLGGNRGYSAGINAGWAAAPADAMLLLNPDLTVVDGALDHWFDALEAGPHQIVAPVIHNLDGALEFSLRRAPRPAFTWAEAVLGGGRAARSGRSEMITDVDVYASDTAAEWVSGAAMLVSAACMDAVGPWDERFFLYSEETDFCLRAGDLGYTVGLAARAGVVHRGGDFTTTPALYSLMTWNRVRLERKRGSRWSALAARAALIVGASLRSVVGGGVAVQRAAARTLLSASQRKRVLPPGSHLEWNGAR